MSFATWYNEIADMPVKQDNTWVDLETGLTYENWLNTQDNKPRFKVTAKTTDARNIAKQFGGKALTGTAKQKIWGEEIRAKVLQSVNKIQAEILCYLTMFSTAKFWIDNRNLNTKELGNRAERAAILIKEINKITRSAESVLVFDGRYATQARAFS